MTYEVVKKEVRAMQNGKELDFNVLRYYATFSGQEPELKDNIYADPFIEVWVDGSLVFHCRGESIFLHEDQWRGVVKAISMAIDDKEIEQNVERDQWLADTVDAKEFYGVVVDLSRNEVIAALTSCEIEVYSYNKSVSGISRTDPIIIYSGKKYDLGRTDLKDDVATGLCATMTAEEWRTYYLEKARYCYGGRVRPTLDGRILFSVIDAFSDG